jgi:hypothetical protein
MVGMGREVSEGARATEGVKEERGHGGQCGYGRDRHRAGYIEAINGLSKPM